QPVESLSEFDRGQPESEQSQVAQHVAKRLGESREPLEPIQESAKQLGRSQAEWALAGKEQYEQTAERKSPQSGAGQGSEFRIALSQPDAEAAKNKDGPRHRAHRSGRMSAPPSGDQVGVDKVRRSDADRNPHHQALIIGIEDVQRRKPRAGGRLDA